MGRTKRTLILSALLLLVGGGLGLYALRHEVQTEAPQDNLLLHFQPAEVLSLRLSRPSGALSAKRTAQGWQITAPVDRLGNTREFEAVLRSVSLLPVSSVVYPEATETQLKELGLSPPAQELSLKLKGGRQLSLRVGHPNPLADKLPATTSLAPKRVVLVPPQLRWVLNRGLDDLRSLRITRYAPGSLTALRIEAGGREAIALEKTPDGWIVKAEPEPLPAKPGVVNLLSVQLGQNLRAQATLTDHYTEEDAARFGFSPPQLRITLQGDAGEEVLLLGQATASGQQALRVEGQRAVYSVDPALEENLAKRVQGIVDRRALRLDKDKIAKIQIDTVGQPRVQLILQNGRWWLKAPTEGPVDMDRVNGLLRGIGAAERLRLLSKAPSPAELERYRLRPPSRVLTLYDAQGETLGALSLGMQLNKDELSARRAGAEELFTVPSAAFITLPPQPSGWSARR